MISTIFLDNDGVLVDTEKYYFEANMETSRRYGYELTLEEYRRLFLAEGTGMRDVADRLGWSDEHFAGYRAERDALFYRLVTTREIVLPGVAEGLALLKSRFDLCIVTSCHRQLFDAVHRRTGFGRFFSRVVSEESVKRHKPHPEPYLTAMAIMRVTPEGCMAIEDSERGLRSAADAKLSCIIVPCEMTRDQIFTRADFVAASFLDAVDKIAKEMKS
jgi:HAD superfamily hydrolase (TIGR01509 family)